MAMFNAALLWLPSLGESWPATNTMVGVPVHNSFHVGSELHSGILYEVSDVLLQLEASDSMPPSEQMVPAPSYTTTARRLKASLPVQQAGRYLHTCRSKRKTQTSTRFGTHCDSLLHTAFKLFVRGRARHMPRPRVLTDQSQGDTQMDAS